MSNVTRLSDHAPVAVCGQEGLSEWLTSWAESFAQGDYGSLRSIVMVLEGEDGSIAKISQSLKPMDHARCVGLLTIAAHKCMDGNAEIEQLEERK